MVLLDFKLSLCSVLTVLTLHGIFSFGALMNIQIDVYQLFDLLTYYLAGIWLVLSNGICRYV
jgi:hypothetical protein